MVGLQVRPVSASNVLHTQMGPESPRTSTYFPPLVRNPFNWRTSTASSSSSIRLFQSSLPVHINTCCAYAAIDPLRFDSRSISRPSGDALQAHVGAGHEASTGNGGGANGTSILEANRRWPAVLKASVRMCAARCVPCFKMNMCNVVEQNITVARNEGDRDGGGKTFVYCSGRRYVRLRQLHPSSCASASTSCYALT